MYEDSSSKVYLKLKRFAIRLGFDKRSFSAQNILVILFTLSVCFNIAIYFIQDDDLRSDDIEIICRQETSNLCNNRSCARPDIITSNETEKGRVIFRTDDSLSITNEDMLLAGTDPDKKVFMTIGLPTVDRKGVNYLETTLNSLLSNHSKTNKNTIKIVVLLADTKRAVRTRRLEKLRVMYGRYMKQGTIQVIMIPQKAYPPLRGLRSTLFDSEQRMYWRSKQAIDFAYLMLYCQHFSPYYLQLEDDVIATQDYDIYIRRYMKEKQNMYWYNLDFSNLGFIGKLFRSETLQNQARFFRLFYTEMPVDLLLFTYRTVLGNDLTKLTYHRNIFEHIGERSSSAKT